MYQAQVLTTVIGDLRYSFQAMRFAVVDEDLHVVAQVPDEATAERVARALNCPYYSCKEG